MIELNQTMIKISEGMFTERIADTLVKHYIMRSVLFVNSNIWENIVTWYTYPWNGGMSVIWAFEKQFETAWKTVVASELFQRDVKVLRYWALSPPDTNHVILLFSHVISYLKHVTANHWSDCSTLVSFEFQNELK